MSETPPPPPPPPPSGSTPPPPPPPGGYGGPEPVGPWPRLGARIIDGLVLLIPSFIVAAIIGGAASPGGTTTFGFTEFIAGVIIALIQFAYFVWLESSRGQTVGKMALGYRVVGPDGANPSTEVAVRRNAWMLVAILPGPLGGIAQFVISIVIGVTISSDPFKRGWHDNLAGGTAVVRSK